MNESRGDAQFEDMDSQPAALEAGRACDACGCQLGCNLQVADTPAAYIQGDVKGTHGWACIPPEARPKLGDAAYNQLQDLHWPVVRLKNALYGHPDAGTYWEEMFHGHAASSGFEPVDPEWPFAYIHLKLDVYNTFRHIMAQAMNF